MSVAICNDRNRRLLRQAFGGTSIEAEDEEFPSQTPPLFSCPNALRRDSLPHHS